MTDLGPMAPCPTGRNGRHELMTILPGEDEGDITLACHYCGATRRMPAMGALVVTPLDDMPSAFIEWEARRA